MIPRLRVVLRWIILGPSLAATLARAQPGNRVPTPDDTEELRVIEGTEQGEDPLGIDRTTGVELEEAAKQVLAKPAEALPSPVAGAVLSSLSQVSETSHRILVRIEQGLAFVQVRMVFESNAKHPAELAYRLALPVGAVISGVSVCPVKGACLAGTPTTERDAAPRSGYETWLASRRAKGELRTGGLAVHAEPIRDPMGDALALRAAPLLPGGKLELEVRYVVESPLRGGRVHVHLPSRGEDPRIAPTSQVRVEAPGFLPLETPDEFPWDATLPLDLKAEWPSAARVRPSSVRAPCGAGTCVRRYSAAANTAPRVRATWLLIDASPSMEGPARGRIDVVLAALLARLPAETPIAAYAFAARARSLGRFSAESASLSALSEASMMSDLDAATRPSSVLAASANEIAREKPRILILSDGLIDAHAGERQALVQARERGAEVWILTLGEKKPGHLARADHVLMLAKEADRALKLGDLSELSDALAVVLSAEVGGGLRTGEQHVVESVPRKPFELAASDHWLAFWMRREAGAPSWMASTEGSLEAPLISAVPYTSRPTEAPLVYTAMPAESVLEMLRTQLVPKARACLRSDRRGRGDYAVALSFRAFFSRREVSEVVVEGNIPDHLRACLTDLLPKLRVPAFSGGVRVRYPIHTDREPPPPVVEMTPEISDSVQRVIAAPLARPIPR